MREKKIHSASELCAEINQKYTAHTNRFFVSTALGRVFKYFSYSKPSPLRPGQLKKEKAQNSISDTNIIGLDVKFGPGCLKQCMAATSQV